MTISLGLVLKTSCLITLLILQPNASSSIQIQHSKFKCQRIRALVKANYKQLKAVLVLRVRNFGLTSIALKLVRFLLFDNFFPDLADFRNLDNFLSFKFPDLNKFWFFNFHDFLIIFLLLLIPNLLTLLFLTSSRLEVNFFNNIIIFSIKINRPAILLKLQINY